MQEQGKPAVTEIPGPVKDAMDAIPPELLASDDELRDFLRFLQEAGAGSMSVTVIDLSGQGRGGRIRADDAFPVRPVH